VLEGWRGSERIARHRSAVIRRAAHVIGDIKTALLNT